MSFISMFKHKFKGGIHPKSSKITSKYNIVNANLPSKIVMPLSQHIGAICAPTVNVGDNVKTGQKIAESEQYNSTPIHSSVSGTVKAIENHPHPLTGKMIKSIVIESDGKDEKIEMPKQDWNLLSSTEIIEIIKDSGIVGLGGAAFPTHIKLTVPKDKKINTILINGAECEPYITSDHRLMLEKSDELIQGIKILQKIFDVDNAFIGIEDNKKDAIKLLKKNLTEENNDSNKNGNNNKNNKNKTIKVVKVPTRYPQGAEKTLIYSVLRKKVPAGKLPLDIGVTVHNVATVIAIYEAVVESKPLYEKVITVSGKVNSPKNFRVRIGTVITDLINQAGGYSGTPKKIINGGPMMGVALPTDETTIVKSTNNLIVFNNNNITSNNQLECMRCGFCLKVCPMHLNPSMIAKTAENGKFEMSKELYAMDCFECGCCSFVCPSKIPLVHWIRHAKTQIRKLDSQNKESKK